MLHERAVQRIVVLGRGGAGKSVFARALSRAADLPLVELDTVFWSPDLRPPPPDEWRRTQAELAQCERWILDGDLGPYDDPAVRLRRADTVVVFDLNAVRCAWRALRRSRERLDFWIWMLTWRRRARPALLRTIRTEASDADLQIIRNRADQDRVLSDLVRRATASR